MSIDEPDQTLEIIMVRKFCIKKTFSRYKNTMKSFILKIKDKIGS
jgi:hypothetical protein